MASKDYINGGEHALAQVRGQLRAEALIAAAMGDEAKARILWDAAFEFTSAWWTEIRHEQALEAGERHA